MNGIGDKERARRFRVYGGAKVPEDRIKVITGPVTDGPDEWRVTAAGAA